MPAVRGNNHRSGDIVEQLGLLLLQILALVAPVPITFNSTKTRQVELLRDIEVGKIQLTNFQRGCSDSAGGE